MTERNAFLLELYHRAKVSDFRVELLAGEVLREVVFHIGTVTENRRRTSFFCDLRDFF